VNRPRSLLAAMAALAVLAVLAPVTAAQQAGDGGVAARDPAGEATRAASAASAAAATAKAAAEQAVAAHDPLMGARPRGRLSYASPWTLLGVGLSLVALAFLIGRVAPGKKRGVRRASILYVLYLTAFLLATGLQTLGANDIARRVWFFADVFEVLTIINLVSVATFDLILLALRIDLANIVQDLLLGGVYVFALLSLLHRQGVNISGLIATSAVVTVVLGLGLQATLGNVIGGIALQVDDSIHEGDWIRLPGGAEGRVKEVRWRHTVVETRNWDTIIVPNSKLLAEDIVILGKRTDQPTQHRMWVYFNVDYRYSPEEVIRVVSDALLATPIPNVSSNPRPNCICFDFAKEGADSVGYYAVRYWLSDLAMDDPTSSEVRVRIYAALKRADIPLALPAHAVFISQDDPQHAERKLAREMGQRMAALEKVDLFQALAMDEKQALCGSMKFAPFTKGEVITMQGASAHWLYVLARGEVEVRVRGDSGRERVVTRMQAPNVFGEMGVMTGEPRTASIIAVTEAECYRIDKDAFRKVVQARPELAEVVSLVIAQRRVELQAVREGLDSDQRSKRVAVERNRILSGIQAFFGLDEDRR